ncbi:acyltransferase [Paenibacillus sp. GCM10023252]|uniref:acyltransferase n=1 Tax=Paenibacillus sp. GCM10023252 TaxID=3252649 RepID=UPI00361CAC89
MAAPIQSSNPHIPQLQLVRAMAIIGVLSVHATASATVTMKNSGAYFIYSAANIFMKFGTPTFILLSSFVLFYSYYCRPITMTLITSFYKKRLLYIILPYVCFSLIYFLIVQYVTHTPVFTRDSLDSLWTKLLTGKNYAHLYFVFISIQFYLLFPLLLWLARMVPRFAYALIPIGFAVQWAFVLYNNYVELVPNKGSWSLSYFSYYMTGAALGIYYPRLREWVKSSSNKHRASLLSLSLWAIWLGAAAVHVLMWYNARLYAVLYNPMLYEAMWNLHSLTSALVLLQLAFLLYREKAWLTPLLSNLGELSFGIYLVHLVYLLAYERGIPAPSTGIAVHLWYLGGFILMLAASWATVAVAARYIPQAWILLGRLPRAKAVRKNKEAEHQLITMT